jgi:hypothetical protein
MASSVTKGVGSKKDWRGGSSVVKNQGTAAPSAPAYNTSSGNHTAPPKQAISGIVVRR